MTLTSSDLGEVAAELGATLDPAVAALYRPRYNLAPSDLHFIVTGHPRGQSPLGGTSARSARLADVIATLALVPARWGLRSPRGLLINARVESAAERERFRDAWARRRCVVPADGFFEWGADRRPFWYHAPARQLLRFAGLYEIDPDGQLLFTVLTTAANAVVAPAHDRMPIVLDAAAASEWLAGRAPPTAIPNAVLVADEVSTRVNSIAHDDPACLGPPTPSPQLKLF